MADDDAPVIEYTEAQKRARFYGLLEESGPFLEKGDIFNTCMVLKEALTYAEPHFPEAERTKKLVTQLEELLM